MSKFLGQKKFPSSKKAKIKNAVSSMCNYCTLSRLFLWSTNAIQSVNQQDEIKQGEIGIVHISELFHQCKGVQTASFESLSGENGL